LADDEHPVAAARVDTTDPLAAPLAAARRESRDPIAFVVSHGAVVSLTGRFAVSGSSPIERAQAFLASHRALFGASELRVRRTATAGTRDRPLDVVVFHQVIDGIDVYAGELSITLDRSEVVAIAGVALTGTLRVDTRPTLTSEEAIAALPPGTVTTPIAPPRLAIYDPRIFGLGLDQERTRLVWQIASPPMLALVDAVDGSTVRVDSGERALSVQVYDAANGDQQTYDSNDGGCQVSSCAGDTDNVVASLNAAYQYYLQYGWVGYDGDDSDHESYINWPPTATGGNTTAYQSDIDEEFHFDAGFTTVDVVGHEFTHGVIEHRADLEYHFQSGALNESFADLMGNIIQGEGFPTALVGEGSPLTVRDMCNPTLFGQVANFGSYVPLPDGLANDYGGVHLYSGIANLAWCKTAQLLHAHGDSEATARDKMSDDAWFLMGALPAEATMPIAASMAMSSMQLRFGALDGVAAGHACVVWDAWNQVGVTVQGALATQCSALADTDLDGVPDSSDDCPHKANPSQFDVDHDGAGDACDDDADGDGVANSIDNCALPNPDQLDSDGDGIGNACEMDKDHDGVDDNVDNCVDVANPAQADADQDYIGDACEADNDGDGILDDGDNCPFVASKDLTDSDGDGLGDACDPCPSGFDVVIAWTSGSHIGGMWIKPKPILADFDGDGVPDGCDAISSNLEVDGVSPNDSLLLAPGARAHVKGTAVGRNARRGGMQPSGVWIDPCPHGDCRFYSDQVPVDVTIHGAGPDVIATIVDDRGRVQARMHDGVLSFAPRGGRRYLLVFSAATDADQAIDVDIDVSGGEAP
jgi:hypothetical protein